MILPMRGVALTLLVAFALAGCGRTNLAVIPKLPLYVCTNGPPRGQPCRDRFDARKLLGLEMPAAEKLAHRRGLMVRPVEIDGHGATVTRDYVSNRIDVAVRDHIVVKIVDRG
jgi:hypothetical protein